VLEKGECLQDNIYYNGEYGNTSYSYTVIEDMDRDIDDEWDIMIHKGLKMQSNYHFVQPYILAISAVLFLFGTTFNVILIIMITCNKDMRTVPNMYILNLAVSDLIIVTEKFYYTCAYIFTDIWIQDDILCVFLPFTYRISTGLTSYSVAVYIIQRYTVTVNPLQFHVSSKPSWRTTGATICLLWIVAALLALPAARSKYLFCESTLLWRTNYYKLLTIFQLFVSCVLPLGVSAFCYITTACHLFESSRPLSEGTQNQQLNTRKNTAKVLLGLTVVFLITYVPSATVETYVSFSTKFGVPLSEEIDLLKRVILILEIKNIQKILLSLNSCLNPVALCCTSRAFRSHFKRYLTCCCKTNSPPTDLELANIN
jgi:hypothetical protein